MSERERETKKCCSLIKSLNCFSELSDQLSHENLFLQFVPLLGSSYCPAGAHIRWHYHVRRVLKGKAWRTGHRRIVWSLDRSQWLFQRSQKVSKIWQFPLTQFLWISFTEFPRKALTSSWIACAAMTAIAATVCSSQWANTFSSDHRTSSLVKPKASSALLAP